MCQRLGQAQLFPATDGPSSAGQLPATIPLSSAGQLPATNPPSSAGQIPTEIALSTGQPSTTVPLSSTGQLPATFPLSSAGQLPATDLPSSAGQLPAAHPLSSAGQLPATIPLSSAGQLPATDLPSSAGKLPANRASPAYLPSSVAGHAGSPLSLLPFSLAPASAAASSVPDTKAQSPTASEREVLRTSELPQLQPANSSMPASPIALRPQLQLQAQRRSGLAHAQVWPQTLSCPSLPPEKTQQATGTTAVAMIHPEQPVETTAVDVIHPEQQHVVAQSMTGSLIAAGQALNFAQVRLSQAVIRISTVEPTIP